MRSPHESACLICARNLGDAVIQSMFFRQLVVRGFAKHYYVWTRPQVAFLFADIPGCEVIGSQFPVGTSKQFDRAGIAGFLKGVVRLRRIRPSVTLDLIGDVRERMFAWLAGSREHLHIGWAPGHPFASIIRNPFGIGRPACVVPVERANVYQAHRDFLDALTVAVPQIPASPHDLPVSSTLRRIGLHPFASQDCKLWPDAQWRELAEVLQREGAEVVAYGAPSDRSRLEEIFGGLSQPPPLITGSLRSFADEVAKLDLMIGLDSFSVHMAERQGVRSVMLNACNHPTLWQPPRGVSVSKSGGCAVHPCMNVPVCESGSSPHVCIRSVSLDDVREAVKQPVEKIVR